MKYLKSINEALFRSDKKSDSSIVPKISTVEAPKVPTLYGNSFRIKIHTHSDEYSNAFHQIYLYGINEISAEDGVKKYLKYHFKKMDNLKIVETLESLSSDYSPSIYNAQIDFSLNKSQVYEFLELIGKASMGLSI